MREVDYKVPGGKMIRIRAEVKNNFIHEVKITGDFFLHPEEGIELLEGALRGKELEREELETTLEDIIRGNSIQLVGVAVEDFVEALLRLKEYNSTNASPP